MRLICFFVAFIHCYGAFSQDEYKVLNWQSELTFTKFLLQRVHQQYAERRKEFGKAVSSLRSIEAYRDSCNRRYKRLLGQLPSKTDLHPQITGTIKRKGYSVEKIIYESIPNHHVTANLYVPEGKGPSRCIIFLRA